MIPSWNRWLVRLQGNRYAPYGNSLPSSFRHLGDCASLPHVAGDDALHGLQMMAHDASENLRHSAKVLRGTGDTTFWGPHSDAPQSDTRAHLSSADVHDGHLEPSDMHS